MKTKVSCILILVVMFGVLFSVGIVIVNALDKSFESMAVDGFVVADKKVEDVTRNYMLFESKIGTVYLLFDDVGRYASVSQATFEAFDVGDFYPNTEPQILIG